MGCKYNLLHIDSDTSHPAITYMDPSMSVSKTCHSPLQAHHFLEYDDHSGCKDKPANLTNHHEQVVQTQSHFNKRMGKQLNVSQEMDEPLKESNMQDTKDL